jgi:hypothetical protein
MGTSESGLFGGIQKFLVGVDKALIPFTQKGKQLTITDFAKAMDQFLSPRTHAFLNFFMLLNGIVTGLKWSFIGLAWAIRIATWPLGLFHQTNKNASLSMKLLGIAMGGVIFLAAAYKTGMFLATLATDAYKLATRAAAFATSAFRIIMAAFNFTLKAIRFAWALLTGEVKLNTLWNWRNVTSQEAETVTIWERDAATGALVATTIAATAATEAQTGATWSLNAALYANPIVAIVVAVVALIAGLVILYFKWKWFHDLVNDTAQFLWRHWTWVAIALAAIMGPLGILIGGIGLLIKHWHEVAAAAEDAWRWMKQAANFVGWATGVMPMVKGAGWIGRHVFGLAGGGTTTSSGVALVGERGPELLSLPRAASVQPLPPSGIGLAGAINIRVYPQDIYLDGEKVARAIATVKTDYEARQ